MDSTGTSSARWERSAARIDELYRRSMASLVPVYRRARNQKPELVGTAFTMNVENQTFLATAAHVSDCAHRSPLFGAFGETLLSLPNVCHATVVDEGATRDDDATDLSFWVLEDRHTAQIGAATPITPGELCGPTQAPRVHEPGTAFVVHGFACTQQPRDVKLSKRGYELGFRSELLVLNSHSQRDRDVANLKFSDTIFLDYEKEDLFRAHQPVVGPDIHGVSGSPVWYCRDIGELVAHEPRLAGVAISWRKKAPAGIIVTPISYLARGIVDFLEGRIG